MSVDGKDDREPRGEMAPEDRDAFKKRSDELGRKLDEAQHRRAAVSGGATSGSKDAGSKDRGAAMGRALRLSAELLGGIIVGSAMGWYLDKWLDNKKPYLFILFFLLGAAAGMLNVIRGAMREKTPKNLPSVKDERDEDR